MNLNLGCGFNHIQGFLNVDSEPLTRPDQVVNLEILPWPWTDSKFQQVVALHVFEHLGESTAAWLGIMQELWRVCEPNAIIRIAVPHPRHDNFLHDPTHVRAVTPVGLAMFDQLRNLRDLEAGGQETKLGLFAGVDFEVIEVEHDFEEPWASQLKAGLITREKAERDLRQLSNVCYQVRITLRAVKPARGGDWKKRFK